jgi:hypothetical protein
MQGAQAGTQFGSFVKDPAEVFHNQNERPLTLELKVSDAESAPAARTAPDATSATFEWRHQESPNWRLSRLEFGQNDTFQLGQAGVKNDGTVLRRGDVKIDLRLHHTALLRLRATFYVGAFRNALNTGARENYFDIQVGDAFIKRWRAMQTGDNLREKRVCKQVCADIERLFGYDRLEIHANDRNDTLQVDVNNRPYRLDEHGAGLAQFILVLVNAAVARPAYILIDEPELNLHPSLQLDFLTAVGKYAEHGLLFATHSIGLVRSAADRIYTVRREAEKGSRVTLYEATANLPEFLGALSYSQAHAVGDGRGRGREPAGVPRGAKLLQLPGYRLQQGSPRGGRDRGPDHPAVLAEAREGPSNSSAPPRRGLSYQGRERTRAERTEADYTRHPSPH